jgi:dienelactone hydrolase
MLDQALASSTARFALQNHLDFLYAVQPRRLAFHARTLTEFEAWQSTLRQELIRLLGLESRSRLPGVAEKLQVIDRETYVEEKYSLNVGEQIHAPMYVLVPKQASPFKAILVFHGHDASVQAILGNYPDDAAARENLAVDNNYAQALAQAGYLVCAVEQRGLGERLTRQVGENAFPRSCRHLAFEYLMRGRSLLGERCWDGLCAINYLSSRQDVVPGVLGCTGHSGGGCTALWLAAIEERLTTAVVSGYFCSFKDSVLAMPHCECNYVPGVLDLIEMGDLAALIAPRSLRVVHGARDPIFPVPATVAQFGTVRRAYQLHDRSEACSLAIHGGAHAYDQQLSQTWFAQWL